jgi:hypothetical protein
MLRKANINKRLAEIERIVRTAQTEIETEVQYYLWSVANPMGGSKENPDQSFSDWLASMPEQFKCHFHREVCEIFPHLKPGYEELYGKNRRHRPRKDSFWSC